MTGQPATAPLRIKRFTLTDFRAFPGPAPALFDLDGKNLLVYGENGSGKSSIYHALGGFFSLKPKQPLREHKNVFSGLPDTDCRVTVEFTDGKASVEWSVSRHPTSLGSKSADTRVIEGALRRACLDYRSLLDTNYRHGHGVLNLFEIAVEHLLRDYPVTTAGGVSTTIGELWERVQRFKPAQHTTGALARINQACVDFNTAFRTTIPVLLPLINELMSDFGWRDVEVKDLRTPGLTYNNARLKQNRAVEGQVLTPDLTFCDHPLTAPQIFLNEARLSALGLAVYLAGRLACTPAIPSSALKLLMLDDVLIGLDHSNRLPVLEVLTKRFLDWQITLLTHDRVWFEMARNYLGTGGQWRCVEVFEAKDVARGILSPIVRPAGEKAAKHLLDLAAGFLSDNHVPAAANYTRASFELGLKSFCERFGVPVTYKSDPRRSDTEALLSAVEKWFSQNAGKIKASKGQPDRCYLAGVIERVKLFRKVVLNPYSHAMPPNIARTEVEGAIASVKALIDVLDADGGTGSALQAAMSLIAKSPPAATDLHAVLGFLRASFLAGLRRLCNRRQISVAFQEQAADAQTLWPAMLADQARLFPPPNDHLPGHIDADRRWLVLPVTESDLAAVTQPDLARLVGLLAPAGSSGLILDSL